MLLNLTLTNAKYWIKQLVIGHRALGLLELRVTLKYLVQAGTA